MNYRGVASHLSKCCHERLRAVRSTDEAYRIVERQQAALSRTTLESDNPYWPHKKTPKTIEPVIVVLPAEYYFGEEGEVYTFSILGYVDTGIPDWAVAVFVDKSKDVFIEKLSYGPVPHHITGCIKGSYADVTK